MSLITKTKLNNKGFSHLEIGITIVVVAVIAVVGGFVYNKNNNKSKAASGISARYDFHMCKKERDLRYYYTVTLNRDMGARPNSKVFTMEIHRRNNDMRFMNIQGRNVNAKNMNNRMYISYIWKEQNDNKDTYFAIPYIGGTKMSHLNLKPGYSAWRTENKCPSWVHES
jgi:uncharacterized protein (UPF0333 family)